MRFVVNRIEVIEIKMNLKRFSFILVLRLDCVLAILAVIIYKNSLQSLHSCCILFNIISMLIGCLGLGIAWVCFKYILE